MYFVYFISTYFLQLQFWKYMDEFTLKKFHNEYTFVFHLEKNITIF